MRKWSKKAVERYEEQRESTRLDLINDLRKSEALKDKGLTVVSRGRAGRGREDYTAGKQKPVYNLKNWKWVEVKDKTRCFSCIISLNMPEIDPGSGNVHCFFDRIGLLISFKAQDRFYQTAIYTDIDLPLNKANKKEIVKIIVSQYDFLRGWNKGTVQHSA